MPIYEYKCQKCEHIMEVRHSISETADSLKLKCENCSSSELEKLISTPFVMTSNKHSSSGSCPTGTCPL